SPTTARLAARFTTRSRGASGREPGRALHERRTRAAKRHRRSNAIWTFRHPRQPTTVRRMPENESSSVPTAFPVTERTRVRRVPQRASHERAVVEAVLDAAPVCHLGFVEDGRPFVIPTL